MLKLFFMIFQCAVVSTLVIIIIFLFDNKTYSTFVLENISTQNCSDLFSLNVNASLLDAASHWFPQKNDTLTDFILYTQIKKGCDYFISKNNYLTYLNKTKEESDIPIAFSMVVYKEAPQVERLLRMIYRPWNYYCIHVDGKSSTDLFNVLEELARCLDDKYHNIIVTRNRVSVNWGQMSVLQSDLNCMKELYDRYKDWKYLINLTGQEFPLKTNAELARILTAYKGANNVEGIYRKRHEDRVPTIGMPFPMVWYKGSVHVTINRHFVEYIFKSPKSKIILDALKDRFIPDEQFFTTLNHNVQFRIPGSYIGDPEEPPVEFMTRFKNWGEYLCESKKIVREICIWGVGDLPKLVQAPHLFANKFYEDFQPATLVCLEDWYYNKIEREMRTGQVFINDTFYESLSFVKNRYIPPLF